jgi:DNA (cytosine-5)-methyltransferase 1
MGFDRPGHERFVIPVSDTQAYKQFGNAVVVPVVEKIAKAMTPHILQTKVEEFLQAEQPKKRRRHG